MQKRFFFLNEIIKLQSWDVIIDFMNYSTMQFKERYTLFLSSCHQYVFLSSARVYADTQPLISETSPRLLDVCKDAKYLKTDEYALSKAREEIILQDSEYKIGFLFAPILLIVNSVCN